MPGIFGVCAQQPNGDVQVIAERMAASMRHHSWYSSGTHSDPAGYIACGQITLRAGSEASPDAAPVVVMLDGEIYDYDSQRRELESEGLQFRSRDASELLARGFERWGQAFLNRLEGYFSAAIWQPHERTLFLVNDRFGMKPLYYGVTPDGFAFASEIKALLKHPGIARQRSLGGVAQFFTFGHFLGEHTLLQSVRVMPPGSVLTYDARGGVAVRRYWQMQPGGTIRTQREALEELDRSFARAVSRRIDGPLQLGLSLSGGLDARTILAAIPRRTAHVKSMSVGIPGSIDHRAASSLAEIAGAEHHCEYLKNDFLERFPEHLRTLVHLTDGHYLDQAITVPTLPVYRSLGIEALLRGHAGELLHMDKAYAFSIRPDELAFKDVTAVESWLWSHLTTYMIEGVEHDFFRPALRAEAAALARQSLIEALAPSERFSPPAQRIWHLFVSERLRRETAMSMQMFGSVVDIRMPYLDAEFVDLTMRVPPTMKMGDVIQSFILNQRSPEFLQVVNANTGTNPGAGNLQRTFGTLKLRMLAKLGVPGYQPYERLGLWLSHQLQPFVADLLLSDRSLDRGLFDPETLRRVIEDHQHRRKNHTFLIMAMLIFELGQRQFIDEDAAELPQPG